MTGVHEHDRLAAWSEFSDLQRADWIGVALAMKDEQRDVETAKPVYELDAEPSLPVGDNAREDRFIAWEVVQRSS